MGQFIERQGSKLLDECMTLGGCPTGDARITGGYELAARYVIHTVGPIWHGGTEGESRFLASCYRKSLELAVANGCTSIAFPAISCGAYGFPIDKAAVIAIRETNDFLFKDETINRVVFACSSVEVQFALRGRAQTYQVVSRTLGGIMIVKSSLSENNYLTWSSGHVQ